MSDKLHMTFLAHDCILSENESWIVDVETVRKIFNVEIPAIKVGFQGGIMTCALFLLKRLIQCFEVFKVKKNAQFFVWQSDRKIRPSRSPFVINWQAS